MTLDLENDHCRKCSKNISARKCFGCERSLCRGHWKKHRASLAEQLNEFNRKHEVFQGELNRDTFNHPLLSSIYAWERKSIRTIQEIAETAREDLQQWTERTKKDVKHSLDQMTEEVCTMKTLDDYTELDLRKWTKQLEELRNLLEKPTMISVVEDENTVSHIRPIKILEKQRSSSSIPSPMVDETIKSFSHPSTHFSEEHFVKIYGPCKLSDENHLVTHSSYRAGLSQINGFNHYSNGQHKIDFLIEKKGEKNLFIGIISSSHQIILPTFDYSVHGWWNLEHQIINGESEGGDLNESVQSGDKITLNIDCDNHQLALKCHRTGKLVHLPVGIHVCPFPWKMLVRLLNTGDAIRILY